MNTLRNRRPAASRTADPCEERHGPIRSLVWQVFGGFVMVVVTLALAGAAQLGQKAGHEAVGAVETRTRELEKSLSKIRTHLAELRAGQEHIREDLRYVRRTLDEEQRQ